MMTDKELLSYSIPELVHLLGSRFRDYRQRAGMTQKEISEKTGISTVTIYKFESGAANNISLATFLLLLKAIGWIEGIDNFMPELPPSPYVNERKTKPIQRVRHKNK